jgi:hypothetical protein
MSRGAVSFGIGHGAVADEVLFLNSCHILPNLTLFQAVAKGARRFRKLCQTADVIITKQEGTHKTKNLRPIDQEIRIPIFPTFLFSDTAGA